MEIRINRIRQAFILVGVALIVAAPNVSAQSSACPAPRLQVDALMLIPANFERFTYTSEFRGKETFHRLGEVAVEALWAKLNPMFDYLTVKSVSSEAAAREMLTYGASDDPDLRQFDLFLIPQIRRVNYWAKGQEYGFEIELVVNVFPYDMSKVTKVTGYGESRTGFYAGSSPRESAGVALRMAVEAVEDGLCGKQRLLLP